MLHTLPYKNSVISYQTFGKGAELLLAFHGYGKDAASLQILDNHCGDKYTIVCINLPFHSESIWNENDAPSQKDWQNIIAQLLQQFNNPYKFSVFGYSIGGQAATCTAWLFNDRINTLWLMAATGIGNDGGYYIAVNTTLGSTLFNRFVTHPNFFLKPFRLLSKIGIIKPSFKTFVERKIDTHEKRALLYQRWMALKNFGVYTQILKKALNTNGSKVLLIYGKKDTVVKYKAAKRFAKGIENVELLLPNEGHYLLTDVILKEAAAKL